MHAFANRSGGDLLIRFQGVPNGLLGMCRLQVLRLAHWAATTALIVYLISRLSEYSARLASVVCLAQAGVIVFGTTGFLLPPHLACKNLCSHMKGSSNDVPMMSKLNGDHSHLPPAPCMKVIACLKHFQPSQNSDFIQTT